ncbi:MAG: TlpA family protein disulfide reductase [Holophagaceae bacterium]|nr:TlpA family protein disulfide reductase [Holophagaceae bacterium]
MDQRKDVSAFAAYDAKSRPTSIAGLKGKVVLVGLWSTRCDPSTKMVMEFASLYPKKDQFGFEILAVNFDENQQDGGGIEGGWRAINKFMNRNRQFFEVSKMPVFIPGLGEGRASNFMDIVYSLPVLFVVDRQGGLAQVHIGYKDGFVGEAVMRALRERPQPVAAPPAPVSAAEPAKPAQQ